MFEFADKLLQKIGNSLNELKSVKPTQRVWKDLMTVRDIVIISDVTPEETETAITNLRIELKKICPSAKVLMISYYDKKVRPDANNFVSNQDIAEYFTDEDFNVFYKIKSNSLKQYLKADYDMAIMIAKGKKKYVPYIFQYIRAALRIGNKSTDNGNMNFIINADCRTTSDTNKEIIKYLKMFFS
ncbi:MAG: hypothetical protein MJZ13_02230 [Bacteroidales bacterium]|nr:hypothetical protein [Bacteroidales bacterium]